MPGNIEKGLLTLPELHAGLLLAFSLILPKNPLFCYVRGNKTGFAARKSGAAKYRPKRRFLREESSAEAAIALLLRLQDFMSIVLLSA